MKLSGDELFKLRLESAVNHSWNNGAAPVRPAEEYIRHQKWQNFCTNAEKRENCIKKLNPLFLIFLIKIIRRYKRWINGSRELDAF